MLHNYTAKRTGSDETHGEFIDDLSFVFSAESIWNDQYEDVMDHLLVKCNFRNEDVFFL